MHPERINRLFLREDRFPVFTRVCKGLAERRRPYKVCENEELERISKSYHHQGVVAMIQAPEQIPLEHDELDQWSAENLTGIVLDSVGNDHNLGAIIRSAAFFDAHFVVLSERDEASFLTTSAYRVAEGGMEYVEIRTVRNMVGFLRSAGKSMTVIGADPHSRLRIRDMKSLIPERKTGIALVVGNEEWGLDPDIKASCSILMRIPGIGALESLNVAQAATLFLHELYEL